MGVHWLPAAIGGAAFGLGVGWIAFGAPGRARRGSARLGHRGGDRRALAAPARRRRRALVRTRRRRGAGGDRRLGRRRSSPRVGGDRRGASGARRRRAGARRPRAALLHGDVSGTPHRGAPSDQRARDRGRLPRAGPGGSGAGVHAPMATAKRWSDREKLRGEAGELTDPVDLLLQVRGDWTRGVSIVGLDGVPPSRRSGSRRSLSLRSRRTSPSPTSCAAA